VPLYSYNAIDVSGQQVNGEGDYPTVSHLFDSLQAKGLDLVSYRRQYLALFAPRRRKIKRVELSEFFRNLALLVRGGVPLREGLQDLTASPEQPAINRVFGRVLSQLEEGRLLSESLLAEQKHVPRIIIPLVAIGEETGRLDQTLQDAANHLEKVQEIISSTRRAVSYPLFVLIAMVGALIFWMVFVLPQLLQLFTTMGLKELPLATRILFSSVEVFDTWWPVIPGIMVFFLLCKMIAARNEKFRYWWDMLWSKFPLAGTIIRSSQLAFFFEYSSLLTSGGIHIVRTMELMEESISNQVLKEGVRNIRRKITAGEPMSQAISSLSFFEPFILRMVKVGEQTGNMPEQFHILAEFYMKKVNNLVSMISKSIEPIIITLAGFIFMVIVLGLLGPVYMLASTIQ
jgi:type II secretory pathway component PulF